MKKRVYGVIGIKSIMSNWNADFSGYPKSISTGEIFGSDKALKYPMKRMWLDQGEKILYIKSLKMAEDKKGKKELRPKSLEERYEEIFSVPKLKDEDKKEVVQNLFTALDVKNFGATFAEEGNNISITGTVQIGQGFNKYDKTSVEEQQILSPFRVENEEIKRKNKRNKEEGKEMEEANASTLGTKIVSSEAHYFYPFVINPTSYNDYIKLGVTEGYTEEDYKKFKEAALVSATAFNTNSKIGCENELSIFIETESDLYLPDITQYIEFEKGGEKDIIRFSKELIDLIDKLSDKIINTEVYYNSLKIHIDKNFPKAKYYNIFTREEL
ncbi:CRISPR-associated protein [Acidilutibacter cellobiosedens]|uniref:CRISPR-associated protein n=2 Tax=Acidilutibacter cellobiosedens TaxID=2507161 RepID=A0A410QHM1_9FIRM|nr:CRISPR-associated protein [Acidilutibacter cellobiosedens]